MSMCSALRYNIFNTELFYATLDFDEFYKYNVVAFYSAF